MTRIVLEFAVRAALIAVGTAGMLQLLRVKSAGARHAAWAGVLGLMLLLPLWTVWGPRASVRVLPAVAATSSHAAAVTLPAISFAEASTAPSPRPRSWNWPATLLSIYLAGAALLLARLAIGTWRARMLVRRASVVDGHLTSASCAAPVTVGVLRPTVILPRAWNSWPQSKLAAVLAHEVEHARRRDPLVQWLALLNRAIFWFHPVAWWLERQLSSLAEEACDAAVLARGCDPYDYSGYLVEMARSIERSGARVQVLGMAMPGSWLPRRIRQIVERGPVPRISKARAITLAAACLTVSAIFAAATVDRQPSMPEPPAPPAIPAVIPEAPPAPPVPVAPVAAPQPPQPPKPAETKYKDQRLYVLYLDSHGMTSGDFANAVAAEQKFVREQLGTGIAALMVSTGNGVRVLQDFTNDRASLLKAIEAPSGDTSASDPATQLDNLRRASDMLAVLPQRKALVYFAVGMTRPTGDDTLLPPAVEAATRANVAIYPIDVRELKGTTLVSASSKIAAADSISVTIDNHLIDGSYTVKADGMLSIPQLADIKAAGLTPVELRAVINDRLVQAGILKDPHADLEVTRTIGK